MKQRYLNDGKWAYYDGELQCSMPHEDILDGNKVVFLVGSEAVLQDACMQIDWTGQRLGGERVALFRRLLNSAGVDAAIARNALEIVNAGRNKQ